MSTFDGKIEEIPDVCIDKFDDVNFKFYFLSHCHSDHLHGLYSSEKFHSTIYCTEISAHFIRKRYPQHCEVLQVLQIGHQHAIKSDDFSFNVTFIPSGHCAGACMMLFQTQDHDIIYTGDFRASKKSVEKILCLQNLRNVRAYIDSTFLNKSYTHFPSQAESVEAIIDEIRNHLRTSSLSKVSLIVPAKIGYEHLIMQINEKLNEKVYVEESAETGYSSISELNSCLSTNEKISRISIRLKARNSANEEIKENVLNIKLSAMFWSNWKKGESFVCREDSSNIRICYATHSSFSEIRDFLHHFKPMKVYLNVIPANFEQRHQMLRDLAEIERIYTERTESKSESKSFSFKRARDMTKLHASKSRKVPR